MTESDDALDRIAGAIVEGSSIDWISEHAGKGSDPRRTVLDELRTVDQIGRLHRCHAASGVRLDDFLIIREIGRGGMGIVYEARQLSLDRRVALKILSRDFELSPRAVRRFEREARAAGILQHPHIVAIHTVGASEGHHYYTMELICGVPLDRIIADMQRGRMEPFVGDALGIPQEVREHMDCFAACNAWFTVVGGMVAGVARALDYAHERGVIHRDIKPANLLLPRDGQLRITDFGLAHVARDPVLSGTGDLLGTPAYMSPEQLGAGGGAVDGRTDLFSLGSVMYELLTLHRPFPGSSARGIMGEILTRDPEPPSVVQPLVPRRLESICLQALQKDPDQRFRNAGSMEQALVEKRPHVALPARLSGLRARPRLRRALRWAAGAALLLAVIFGAYATRQIHRSEFLSWSTYRLTSDPGWETDAVISPDGNFVAFASDRSGASDIWVVDAAGGNPLRLTRHPGFDRAPAWYPDGRFLAYVSDRNGQGSIWKVPVLGGTPTMLVESGSDPAVSPDGGSIAFAARGRAGMRRIFVGNLSGSRQAREVTRSGDGSGHHDHPVWSPDGEWLAYADLRDIWVVPTSGGVARRLTHRHAGAADPSWSPDGRHVYYSSWSGPDPSLWRVPVGGGPAKPVGVAAGPQRHPSIAPDGLRLAYSALRSDGDLVVLVRGRGLRTQIRGAADDGQAALAPDGQALVFRSRRADGTDLWWLPLVEGQPQGSPVRVTHDSSPESLPRISPDGEWIVFTRALRDQSDLWIVETRGGVPAHLTDSPDIEMHPAWSPDGRSVAFVSDRMGGDHIWVGDLLDSQRLVRVRRLTSGPATHWFPDWSPDGRFLAFVFNSEKGAEVAIIQADGKSWARVLTTGAQARYVRWLDSSTLAVSGTWGRELIEVRRVGIEDSQALPFDPLLILGDRQSLGTFDISADAELVTFDVSEQFGDIWLLDALTGHF